MVTGNENIMKLIYEMHDITLCQYSICLKDGVMVITLLSEYLIVTMIEVKYVPMVTLHL